VGDLRANLSRIELAFVALLLLFMASFAWNRTLGISSAGWFEFFAHQIGQGYVPYRDFYLFSAPLLPTALAGLFKITGESMTVSLLMGSAMRVLCGLLLFGWMRAFSVSFAAAAATAVAATTLFGSDTADPGNIYNAPTILLIMASARALHLGESTGRPGWNALAGVLAVLALLTKQTMGLLWLAFALAGPALALLRGGSRRGYLALLAGIAATCIVALAVLAATGALAAFADQVFISGPRSKGSPGVLVMRILDVALDPGLRVAFKIAVLVALLALGTIVARWRPSGPPSLLQADRWPSILMLCLWVALIGWLGFSSLPDVSSRIVNYVVIIAGMLCALAGGVLYLGCLSFNTRRLGANGYGLFMIAGAAMAVYVGLALSFPIFEPMAMPTLACLVLVPFVAAQANGDGRTMAAIEGAATMAAGALLLSFVSFKTYHPYNWAGWDEPQIHLSTASGSDIPKLGGLMLNPHTHDVIGGTVEIINGESRSETDLFTYPHLPLFYFLTNKRPVTFSYIQYADVTSDAVLDADIDRLRQNKPRVIVMMPYSETATAALEYGFRKGQPSGIRRLNEFLLSLKDEYEERARWDEPDGPFLVWVRRSP
jgi:hypothetical protein